MSLPAYLAARSLKLPDRRARGEREARAGQPRGRPPHPPRRGELRRAACAGPSGSACRCGGRSPGSTAARGRAEGRDFFGLDPDLPAVLVFGGSQGARRLNEAVWGALPDLRGPGDLHPARGRPQGGAVGDPAGTAGRPALRPAVLHRPDGPGLRGGRPGGVPLRRDDLRRDRGRGPAGGLRPVPDRQRRAALQRRAGRGRRRRGCWWTTRS